MPDYPLTVFHFSVSISGLAELRFSDVTGLSQEIKSIEYRDGLTGGAMSQKRPGIRSGGNVTLKRGFTEQNIMLFNWFNNEPPAQGGVQRRTVTINLLNDEGNPVFAWRLDNAFPVKITGADLKATGNDIAIETIELVHEGITQFIP